MIYLITCLQNNSCKIGFSSDPKKRLTSLQTSNPYKLELSAIIDGDIIKEKELHEKFKEFSLLGEWFKYNQSIMEFFNSENYYLDYPTIKPCNKYESRRINEVSSNLLNYFKSKYPDYFFAINKSLKLLISERINCTVRELSKALLLLIKEDKLIEENKLIKVNY